MFEADDLDKILAYAIEHHIYSAKEIRNLIKEKGFEILHPQAESEELKYAKESAPDGLTRSLDYYENNVKEEPQKQDLELEGLLRQLKLVDIRENCDDLVSEAIERNEGQEQ